MVTDGRFKKAGLTLGLSYIVEHGLTLLRTVLVARFIGPDNFGLAVTFLLVVSTFTLISDLGIEKYLIHARERELPTTTATLASVLLARGIVLGATIWLLSGWIAARFGHPDLAWVYACAALIPVVEGFRHLDPLRQQRTLNYLPSIKVQLGSLVPGVLLTVTLASLTESYIAVVVGSLVTSVLSVVLSHILASTRYRLGFDRTAVTGLLSYGWPLMLNGVVIFFGTQGDRIVIAALEGLRDLAGYVAVGSLTIGLSLFLAKLSGNLYLPLLSDVRDDPARFALRSRLCGAASMLMLSITLLPMTLLGAPIVTLLFGEAYRTAPAVAAFLSIQAAAVVLRAWPVVIALSIGSTGDILIANLVRIVGLVGAVMAVRLGYGITGVAACMAAGDVAGTLLSLWRSGRRTGSARLAGVLLGAIFCALSAAAILLNLLIDPYAGWAMPIFSAVAVSLPGVIVALLVSADLRQKMCMWAMQLLTRVRR